MTKSNSPTSQQIEQGREAVARELDEARKTYDAAAFEVASHPGDTDKRKALAAAERQIASLEAEGRAMDSALREVRIRESTAKDEARFTTAQAAHAELPAQLDALKATATAFDAKLAELAAAWDDVEASARPIRDGMGALLRAKEREPGDFAGSGGIQLVPLLANLPDWLRTPDRKAVSLLTDATTSYADRALRDAAMMMQSAERSLDVKRREARDGKSKQVHPGMAAVEWAERVRSVRTGMNRVFG